MKMSRVEDQPDKVNFRASPSVVSKGGHLDHRKIIVRHDRNVLNGIEQHAIRSS